MIISIYVIYGYYVCCCYYEWDFFPTPSIVFLSRNILLFILHFMHKETGPEKISDLAMVTEQKSW